MTAAPPSRAARPGPFRRLGSPVLDPAGRPAEGPVLVLRPRRVRIVAWVCAVGVVAAFAGPAAVLRHSEDGVYFRAADQVAVVLLGVLIAAGILLLARPRVRADARGVEVRNVGFPRYLPWESVTAVAFPDGASWARLELPHDEYVSMLAVQAVDGRRAVAGMQGLRARHRAARAPAQDTPVQDTPAQDTPAQETRPDPDGPDGPDRGRP